MKQRRIKRKQYLQIVFLLLCLAMVLLHFSRNVVAHVGITEPKIVVENDDTSLVSALEMPYCVGVDTTFLLRNEAGHYALMYDTTYRQAAWVAYVLTAPITPAVGVHRRDRFVPDPQVLAREWPSAETSDYTHSGYDRGHLLPSADRVVSQAANDATFLLSNISPQRPALNRGIWSRLEAQVRRWADRYGKVYVVTGPVFAPDAPCLKGGVGVPRQFFKALLVEIDGVYYATAFLLPNDTKISGGIFDYDLTVDSLEQVTGYDFFFALPDSIEESVEAVSDAAVWQ